MFSSVTAGTLLISDSLLVRATANPGESFLDRMIHLVEGAKRQKTPNEMALTVLLAILTLIFVIVGGGHGAGCGLLAGAHQHRRSDRAPGRAHSDHHRRAALRHRHRRHRPHLPVQRPRHVRQGRGGGRRRADVAARQDRHDHHGQPAGDRVHSAPRTSARTRWFRRPILPPAFDTTPEGRSVDRLRREARRQARARCSTAAGAWTSRRRRA